MRVKKGSAFALALGSIIALSILAVAACPEGSREAVIAAIFPGAILGIVGVTTAFITGNVADNGVKGKFYNPSLDLESFKGEAK
jgi:hypothetical protein